MSEATVGRILRRMVASGRALPCSFCEGRVAAKPRDRHVGVQFDHMTLRIDGKTFKEFRAVCPLTRRQHARVFSSATARIA